MHAAIARAHRALASGQAQALTLDIFETVVRRDTALPEDAHFLLGHRLAARAADPQSYSAALFAHGRIQAHARAQRWTLQARGSSEPTLVEIYRHFPLPLFRGLTSRDLAAAELAMEDDILRPDAEILALAEAAEAAGLPVALVSDTVFDDATLRDLVERVTGKRFARVYSSCDHGRSKAQGLLTLVAQDLGVAPAGILHLGDNDAADGAGAFLAGAHYQSLAAPEMEEILHAEQESAHGLAARAPLFGSRADGADWGLSGLRRRLYQDDALADPLARYGAVVAGPLLSAFAHWVADRVRTLGASHVLFMMREGRLIKRLADPLLPPEVTTAEVFTSRYATGRAALASGDPAAVERFLYRYSAVTGRRAAEELELPEDVAVQAPFADQPLTEGRLAEFVRWATSPRVLRHVVATGQRTRQGFLAHVAGLAEPGPEAPTVLVDIGYNGSAQAAIQEIFNLSLPGAKTHGLYLVTGEGAIDNEKTGAVMEGYLGQYGLGQRPLEFFIRAPELLEQCMMTEVGSVLDYAEDGTPRLAPPSIAPDQLAAIGRVQAGIAAFHAAWREHLAHATGPAWVAGDPAVRGQMLLVLERMIMAPTEGEMSLIGGWAYDENVGSTQRHSLAAPATLDEPIARALPPGEFLRLPARQVYWLFGAAHRLRGPGYTRRLRLLANGGVAPGDLMAGTTLPLKVISVDPSGGQAATDALVQPGADGHALLRLPVRFPKGLAGLLLTGWRPGVVVRLHGLHLRAGDWRFDAEGEDLARLAGSTDAMPQVAPLLFHAAAPPAAEADGPCLRLATPMLAEASGQVEVNVHLAVLP